ncbi:hypothetical protein BDV06DRAFT_220908 [Aspergillus oleicola]
MDHSLLAYARFHGIASDYTAIDPLSLIDDTFTLNPEDVSLSQHIRSECETRLRNARSTLDQRLRSEKLSVSKDTARFLTSVIREIKKDTIDIDWDALLPEFWRLEDLQVEPIVFSLETESDVRLSRRPLRYDVGKIEVESEIYEGPIEISDVPNPLDCLRGVGISLLEQVKDKLKASRKAFSLIQAIQMAHGPSTKELEGLLEGLRQERRSAPFNADSPVLLPLNEDYFPPSPTSAPYKYMLPSPVSSTGLEVDLYCRRTPVGSRPAGTVLGTRSQRPMSLSPTRKQAQVDTISTEKRPNRDAKLIENESDPDADPQANNISNDTDESRVDTTSTVINCATDQSPGSLHEDERHSPALLETTNKRARVPTPECAEPAIQQVHRKRPRTILFDTGPRANINLETLQATSMNQKHTPSSQTLPKHAATAVSKPLPPRQTMPEQNPRSRRSNGTTNARHKARSSQQIPNPQTRLKLGSLSSFLETRGRAPNRHNSKESPYFARKDAKVPEQPHISTEPRINHQPKPDVPASKPANTPSLPLIQAPRAPTNHESLVLFTSTALLKTHPKVMQCLEGSEHPPKLIFRDYDENLPKRQARPSPKGQQMYNQALPVPLPEEADMILSPKTGLILTTSQATMQLYLPGHKPSIQLSDLSGNFQIPMVKSITSPLREIIFRLASRYEQLYILITHNADNTKRPKPRTASTSLTLPANKSLLTSLTSLNAFCTSLSNSNSHSAAYLGYASITPLLMPSTPDSITSWILALAHRHTCPIPSPRPLSQRNAFTPINPKPQLVGLLGDGEESIWEVFLRRAGLNPFAARVVLGVLGRDDETRYEQSMGHSRASCLSRFVEMSVVERRGLFGGILGERCLRRVESLIERDWQCDWALRFDDEIEWGHLGVQI